MATELHGVLAAMADSDASAIFYAASAVQVVVAGLGLIKAVREYFIYRVVLVLALLMLPILLGFGIYYASLPPA